MRKNEEKKETGCARQDPRASVSPLARYGHLVFVALIACLPADTSPTTPCSPTDTVPVWPVKLNRAACTGLARSILLPVSKIVLLDLYATLRASQHLLSLHYKHPTPHNPNPNPVN